MAILKDICDALNLKTFKVSQRLEPRMLRRVPVESDIPSRYIRSRGENKTRWMLAVNEHGIYEALFTSRRLEARQFRGWVADMISNLRKNIGLQGYEVMRMTDPDIQEDINHIFDTIYWNEETGELMQSVTVRNGDVAQRAI